MSVLKRKGSLFWGARPPQQGVGCLILWLAVDSAAGWMFGIAVLVPGAGAGPWMAPQGGMEVEWAAGPGRTWWSSACFDVHLLPHQTMRQQRESVLGINIALMLGVLQRSLRAGCLHPINNSALNTLLPLRCLLKV